MTMLHQPADVRRARAERRTERWAALLRWLEDASGYVLLAVAVGALLTLDTFLWFTFGPWFFATMAAACGSVAAVHYRQAWPLLLALGAFLACAVGAAVAVGLLAVGIWLVGMVP